MTTPRRGRAGIAVAITTAVIGVSVPTAAFAAPSSTPTPHVSAEDLVSGLDADQRAALERLSTLDVSGLHFDDAADKKSLDSEKPVDVIVTFKQQPAQTSRELSALDGVDQTKAEADAAVEASHDAFEADLDDIYGDGDGTAAKDAAPATDYAITDTYTDALNGVAMTLPGDQVAELLESDEVASVWPDQTVHALADATTDVDDRGVATAPTTALSDITTSGGTAATSSKAKAPKWWAELPGASWWKALFGKGTTTPRTQDDIAQGILDLHADGVTGKGVKVGVIDTGIDYDHPDLKAVYAGGYDFVDDDADPMETTYADWKASGQSETVSGSSYYTEHGTHVAGIIAGQGADSVARAAHGVAPGVKIYSYRALGPYGSGSTSDIVAAMDRAVSDGMDVVNMSLGASVDTPLGPEAMGANNMVLAGVTAVIAAGNAGPGLYTLGTPGAAALPLTVGANDTPLVLPSFSTTVGGTTFTTRLVAQTYADGITPLQAGTHAVVDVGVGAAADYAGKSVTGKVVLVDRGTITLNEKIQRAASQGAAGVLLVNNVAEPAHVAYYLGENATYLPTFSVTQADGDKIAAAVSAGTATMKLAADSTFVLGGGQVASFSSFGPVSGTNAIKPEVTAPGVSVLSSVPADIVDPVGNTYTYAYARLDGTSMATPYVAGAAALLLQHDPTMTPAEVKSALMNTAAPLAADHSVYEIGAGEVDPEAAVQATSSVTVLGTTRYQSLDGTDTTIDNPSGALDLGTFPVGKAATTTSRLSVANDTSTLQTYTVSAEFTRGSGTSADAKANKVKLTTTPLVIVPKHGTAKVSTLFTAPRTAAAGYYEGTITLTPIGIGASRATTLHVPFGGRIAKTGIAAVDMTKSVLSTNQGTGKAEATGGEATFNIQLDGQLESMDVFLGDAEGNDFGYVGAISTLGLSEGVLYGPATVKGWYYPLTGDDSAPVDPRGRYVAKDGHYTLHVVATDENGTTYSEVRDLYVDTEGPSYTDSIGAVDTAKRTIIEIPADATSYDVKGTLLDDEVSDISAAGIDVTQASGKLSWGRNSPNAPDGSFPVAADGSVSGTVPVAASTPVSNLYLWPQDAAGNIGPKRNAALVRKGWPYLVGDASVDAAKPGDLVTYTLTPHSIDQWKSFSAKFRYDNRLAKLVSITTTDAAAKYEPSAVKVSAPTVQGTYDVVQADVDFGVAGGVTADSLPTFEVTYEVLDSTVFSAAASITPVAESGVKVDGTKVNIITVFFGTVQRLNQASSISGTVVAQALLTDAGAFDTKHDYSKDGYTATLTAPDGTVRTSTIDSTGRYTFASLPVVDDTYRLKVTAPGHFTWYEDVDAATNTDHGLGGALVSGVKALVAGDVNGDEVVDAADAWAVYAAKGTTNRAADIDADGVVDAKDMRWVVDNYRTQNGSAPTVTNPVLTSHGKTLDQIVALMK